MLFAWRILLWSTVTYLALFVTAVSSRRLPRGFTPTLFCSACRAVAREVHDAHVSVPDSETIDAGSFRLSESGKQPDRRQVPLRNSELHAVTVLDAACTGISTRYVIFDLFPQVFVSVREQKHHDLYANVTADCAQVRALRELCTSLIDDIEEDLKQMLKNGKVTAHAWTGSADELCGEHGLFPACNLEEGDPPVERVVIDALLRQKEQHHQWIARDSAQKEQDDGNASAILSRVSPELHVNSGQDDPLDTMSLRGSRENSEPNGRQHLMHHRQRTSADAPVSAEEL